MLAPDVIPLVPGLGLAVTLTLVATAQCLRDWRDRR